MSRYSTFRSRYGGVLVRTTTKDQRQRTSYRPDRLRLLASRQEDDIALARVDIVVLEEEDLVDSVFLECAELDE